MIDPNGETMRWVTTDQNRGLLIDEKIEAPRPRTLRGFEESITPQAVHELLFQPSSGGDTGPCFPALLAAKAALNKTTDATGAARFQTLVWVDPAGMFYPPAAGELEIAPSQICVVRPRPADLIWTTIECLRCQSVGAVVALITQRLTRVEVRRLQLAAEKGAGVGLLLRPNLLSAGSNVYAAATRWLVSPAPGERTVQRWHLRLIHGYGGQVGQSYILEKHRASGETNFVHPSPALADPPILAAAS